MAWIGTVTNKGTQMIEQVAGGGHTLTLTRASVGSGTRSAVLLKTATALVSEVEDITIVSREDIYNSGQASLKIVTRIYSGEVGFTAHEIGIWAKVDDGTEYLFSIHQTTDGVVIPVSSDNPDFNFDLNIVYGISNVEDINVTVNTSSLATITQVNNLISNIKYYVTNVTVSSLPATITNTNIKSAMVVVSHRITGGADKIISDLVITPQNGSIKVEGSITGSVSLRLAFGDATNQSLYVIPNPYNQHVISDEIIPTFSLGTGVTATITTKNVRKTGDLVSMYLSFKPSAQISAGNRTITLTAPNDSDLLPRFQPVVCKAGSANSALDFDIFTNSTTQITLYVKTAISANTAISLAIMYMAKSKEG